MGRKFKTPEIRDFSTHTNPKKEELLSLIKESPGEVVEGLDVIDLSAPNLKIDRKGKIVKVEDNLVTIQFPNDLLLITKLRFYGITWGLLKN